MIKHETNRFLIERGADVEENLSVRSVIGQSYLACSSNHQDNLQIRVPGVLVERLLDWYGVMKVTVESESHGPPVTLLTGTVDQAVLQGLLRSLYYLGLPVTSVICVEGN